jgi:glycine/D-amino acid oxidase-like deaminating enzyme
VSFFRDSPVEEVTEDKGVVAVKTARGVIRAQHAVVATNSQSPTASPFTRKPLPTGPT